MYALTKERREETNKVQVGRANTPTHTALMSVLLCIRAPVSFLKARQRRLYASSRCACVRLLSVCLFMRLLLASAEFPSPPEQHLL